VRPDFAISSFPRLTPEVSIGDNVSQAFFWGGRSFPSFARNLKVYSVVKFCSAFP